ncbi:MAG: SDR family oxidoreductase [Actinomycetes bacterium]
MTGGGRFAGKTAIITGASRGIGLAIARRLVDEGARVVITARKPEPLAEAATLLGGEAVARAVAGRADDVEHQRQTVREALTAFGTVDVLVNNTGINPTYGPVIDTDLDVARKIIDVNVLAAVSWVREIRTAQPGPLAVVNIASVAGLRPAGGIGVYGVSKAALLQLTAQLAVELAPEVRVNAVAPAVVRTRFATALFEGREEQVAATYPLRRLGEPQDVAGAVAFLASDDAAWITGQTLVIDGGLLLAGGV